MPDGELDRAMDRRAGRQLAILQNEEIAGVDLEAMLRMLLSGLDVDLDEVDRNSQEMAGVAEKCLESGITPITISLIFWLDGIMIGLMIAEERAQRGDRAQP